MKRNGKLIFKSTVLATVLILASCSEDEEIMMNENEVQLTETELQTVLETEETISVVDNALVDLYNQEGNSLKSANECYNAEYTDTGFTATFNNCVLNGTDNINGTLSVTYATDNQTMGYAATFSDFYVGDIKINGSRSFVFDAENPEDALSFTVTSDISVELADGSTLSETGTKTLALIFEEGEDTLWNLSGNWTVMADGNTYVIAGDVSKQLNCQYWSSGIMEINKNGLALDVDFGDGTCDNKATVIYPNGATDEIDL